MATTPPPFDPDRRRGSTPPGRLGHRPRGRAVAIVEPARAPTDRGVLDGADSAKGSKGRLAVQSLGVVSHGDQESDGAVRTDAHRFEQLRGMAFNEPGQALVELPGTAGNYTPGPVRSYLS
jgi:hypothetical protein